MNREYGIVLVGCGMMGAAHLEEIYYRENIRITGVVDLDPERAQAFKRRYGALSWSTDYTSYLDDPSADIFIIATYPSTHLDILRACISHGKHVLCEKPIATNAADAEEFVQLVKEEKAKVLVGHILRHNRTYNTVAEMLHRGAVGNPMVIRMVQNHHTMNWDRYKRLITESSPIIDCGVHYIDIMEWFTRSTITTVSGIGCRTEEDLPPNAYNYGMITMKFADGSVAYYEAGWGNTIASGNLKEFIGPKGRIRITYKMNRDTNQEEGDLIEYYSYPEGEYKIINMDSNRKPTWEQLQHLIRMIEDNIAAVPDIDEVFRAYEIVSAADMAIKTGKVVSL
jgi:predicted dehydrogenase